MFILITRAFLAISGCMYPANIVGVYSKAVDSPRNKWPIVSTLDERPFGVELGDAMAEHSHARIHA